MDRRGAYLEELPETVSQEVVMEAAQPAAEGLMKQRGLLLQVTAVVGLSQKLCPPAVAAVVVAVTAAVAVLACGS